MTEWTTWQGTLDKHSRAHESLLDERGQRIGRLLGGNVLDPATGCVQCHNVNVDPSRWARGCIDARGNNLCQQRGVGCEACHGPSARWDGPHDEYPVWRNADLEYKTELGWVDVRSPITRAEVCTSCHVGSAPHGRLITHAMYAAGHPPLSGFEIESFADKMPRHWRYSYEKKEASNRPYQRTQNLLTASIVSIRMAVELAMADAAAPADERRWPELARMDCYDCHHELREPSWRQLRAGSSSTPVRPPGRPRLAVGSLPLAAIATDVALGPTADAEFTKLLGELHAPFEHSAFGDPAVLARRGAAMVGWCRSVESRLASAEITAEVVRGVLHSIAEHAASDYRDFDTARQLFGAWTVVFEELVANGGIELSAAARQQVNSLLERIDQRDPFIFEPKARFRDPAKPPEERSVEMLLPRMFSNRVIYDPAAFASLLQRLDALTRE
jgi:hypothetical protein